jgi:hypothetical protein
LGEFVAKLLDSTHRLVLLALQVAGYRPFESLKFVGDFWGKRHQLKFLAAI